MGRIAAPFGVQGWIKIQPFTEEVDGLADFDSWWLGDGKGWREVAVKGCNAHGATLVAKLEGCNDRDAAATLKGSQVAVPRSTLPRTAKDEYYWSDLIGLAVVNLQGEALGKVSGLLETGVHDVMVVQNGQERLIPFIAQYVIEVDVAGGQVRVDWGLDY